jgi:tRNA (guanine-N7-)-methyltransferase
MAVLGRPTPQRELGAERPRYRDREPQELLYGDLNPFMQGHQSYGRPLLPAGEAWTFRGRWHEEFGRDAPLHLEIGSGNGFFLTALAAREQAWNLVGVELRYKRTVLCARKLTKAGVTNARILRYHAAFLDDLFEPGTISAIYVNHPDPWPKGKHEKNRLISRWFLEDVASLLQPGGVLQLKSDHRPNIERVERFLDQDALGEPAPRLPLQVTGRAEDVTTGPAPWPDDIETNYQSKFRRRGEPVYAIELVRTDEA